MAQEQTADSWEDNLIDETQNMNMQGQRENQQHYQQRQQQGGFNPNVQSFNPGAGTFVPGGVYQPPQQQYYQPQQGYDQGQYNQYQGNNQYQGQGNNQQYNLQYNSNQQYNQGGRGGYQGGSQRGGRGGYYGSRPPQQQQYQQQPPQQQHQEPVQYREPQEQPRQPAPEKALAPPKQDKPDQQESKPVAKKEDKKESNPAVISTSSTKDDKKEDKKEEKKEEKESKKSGPTSGPAHNLQSSSATDKPKKAIRQDLGIEHLNLVFIGHVDAGKSTIGGQIMFITGGVDARTLEKYEKEAAEANRGTWYLAWCIDTNQEERDKGKTVEVGRANFMTEKKKFTVLDAPGHKSFVPNMISGAAQADIAILVVSARKGEFEAGFDRSGQTREHAMLAKTAGVKHLVVLVNKMDDPSVGWDVERYKQICRDISPFLKKCGYSPKMVHFMPASGLTGLNIKEPIPAGQFDFYKGPPLLQYLDDLPSIERLNEWFVRMPINERFKDMGTLVMGKLESGVIEKGDKLVLMPNKIDVEVTEIYDDEGEVDFASAGSNIRIKLKGVEESDITIGHVLCAPESLCPVVSEFDAQIVLLDVEHIVAAGFDCVAHVHATVEEVRFKALIATIDRKTGKIDQKKPRFAKQDQIIVARLECTTGVLCMELFKTLPQMGRFTLRDKGKTIAIGKIMKLIA
ncbi:hypothetical protein SARC_02515 [Sphaeroforma arctica JP610]|uniref:Tr-type G domain-containing protein n=1 Tax=Sphaeroforma arctica JP610 TaxID=667725 RepID=A0A0L0G8C6_9EUKA|nr:hypothetical protein SARC_02515 [Sphaeroforma arctica JP610]KNC85292.1 hypothetical protein SARC_02515 [Sphaeroforma arctica JP610]|eukprot:XP_014159194.1 hypothetical protein SARC_02515 [Sphaeroforma arctica JP610]